MEKDFDDLTSLGYLGHSSQRRNDFQFQMIRIRHQDKYSLDFDTYNEFRKKGLFTDLALVMKGGEKLELHSLAIVGKSKLLQSWMNNINSAESMLTIHVPDYDINVARDMSKILYGQELHTSAKKFSKIKCLAEALGISFHFKDKSLSMLENSANIREEFLTDGKKQKTSNFSSSNIPLCCWHCSKPFSSPETLQIHMKKHIGEPMVKKTHKCPKCKKVLPSMWKFRQHLITHKQPTSGRLSSRQDHQYAGPVPVATKRPVQRGDHIYAEPINNENQVQSQGNEESVGLFENATLYHLKETHTQPKTDHTYTEQNSASEDESCPLPGSSDHMYAESPEKSLNVTLTKPKNSLKATNLPVDLEFSSNPHPHPDPTHFNNHSDLTIDHLYAVRGKSKRLSAKLGSPDQTFSNTHSNQSKTTHAEPGKLDKQPSFHENNSEVLNQTSQPEQSTSDVTGRLSKSSFQCDDCPKSFSQKYRLSRHVREVHEKVRPHKCRFCPKEFFKPFSLQRHELVHSSHSLWVCSKCKKKFRDQSSLTYHTRRKVCQNKMRDSKKL